MDIVLIRHAAALARSDWNEKGHADELRPLTDKGRKQMRRSARGLAALLDNPDVILSSPFTRANDTALLLQKNFSKATLEVAEELTPAADVERLFERIMNLQGRLFMAVGHEPALSTFLGLLIGSSHGRSPAKLKKGSACLVSFEATPVLGQGVLNWLLTPDQLSLIGQAAGK